MALMDRSIQKTSEEIDRKLDELPGKSMDEAAPSVVAFFEETVTQLIHQVSVAPTPQQHHHRHQHHHTQHKSHSHGGGKVMFAKKAKPNNSASQQ